MKNSIASVVFITIGIMMINPVMSQELSRVEKLKLIDKEIAEAQNQKKSGFIKMGLGLGIMGAGFFAFYPSYELNDDSESIDKGNRDLFWLCYMAGAGLSSWGGFQYRAAARTVSALKTKRYDYVFSPSIIPDSKGNIQYGIALNIEF